MHTLKAIPAAIFALSMPMAAPLSAQPAQTPVLGDSCTLLHIGGGGPLHDGLQALLKAEELVDMSIRFASAQKNSADYSFYAEGLELAQDSLWALVATDSSKIRRLLLQGSKLPSVADIQKALEYAGAKTPISALREFLKKHPGHLEARIKLIEYLRKAAETRTRSALKLDAKSSQELGLPRNAMTLYSTLIDTSTVNDKKLAPEQDAKIWGPYAQELNALFNSGNWPLVDLPNIADLVPIDMYSPTLLQAYRQHIPKVEAYLGEYQSNPYIWQTYAWMALMSKQGSVKKMLDGLVLVPDERMAFPVHPIHEVAASLLISEELSKETPNWGGLAEALWQAWPDRRLLVFQLAEAAENDSRIDAEWVRAAARGSVEIAWKEYLNPLLESLIKANRISEAETALLETVNFEAFRGFQRRAADLALAGGKRDLHAKWLALQIPEKAAPDMEASLLHSLNKSSSPYLVVINPKGPADYRQVNEMINQSSIFDWRLSLFRFSPASSELLRQKEGWPEGETHWALSLNSQIIAHGPGVPTEAALLEGLESSHVQTPAGVLRRFISEHPSRLDAKESLLRELKRLAEHKTRNKLGDGAGVDTAISLNDKDDHDIWFEYAILYRQLLPQFLSQARPPKIWFRTRYDSPFSSNFFMHSQTMKNLAPALLPQIEASLALQPADEFVWGVWSGLSDLATNKNRNIRGLLETLAPAPNDDAMELPPSGVRRSLTGRFRARSDWQGVAEVLEWKWKKLLGIFEQNPARLKNEWSEEMKLLLEAYLRLDKDHEASEFIRIWSQSPNWDQIKQSAIELAEKCGKEALAKQWR